MMNLRIKYLLGFILLTVSAFTLFGLIAYDKAEETSLEKEKQLLKQVFSPAILKITQALDSNDDIDFLLKTIINSHDNQTSIVIHNEAGQMIYHSPALELYNKIRHLTNKAPDGQFTDQAESYTWSTLPIPDSGLKSTFTLKMTQASQFSFLHQMGYSLTFIAFMAMLIGVWASRYVALLTDKLNEQSESLQHQASHDKLTGLPTRFYLRDQLDKMFKKHDQAPFALCFINLNHFKVVNDTLGYHCGDKLLETVSKRLINTVKHSDTVVRFAGDEFAVLLPNTDQSGVETVIKNIVQTVESAIILVGKSYFVSCSIGIAKYPADGKTTETLLQNAEAAMYCAKNNGLNSLFYDPEQNSVTENKLRISSDLRDAIHKRELLVFYQAKLDLTEKIITGAEALARWNHPEKGFIPPSVFIETAEKNSLITPLSYLIIEKAFRDQKILESTGHPISIAINLSSCNLANPDFVGKVIQLAKKYRINPEKFKMELTESAMMSNPEQVKKALITLSETGFIVSIDDFGTGYSSLVNLKRLPVNEIKIDRSFVFNLFNNEEDASIVRTTIALGRSLGINVVAEGVESEEILKLIGVFGCNEAQGYFISKPIPFDEFHTWLSLQHGHQPPLKKLNNNR